MTVRWQGEIADAELRAGLADLDRWLSLGLPFTLLIDARGGWPFSAAQRSSVVAHINAHRRTTERLLVQAVVIDNALIRALYYAVNWAVPLPFPSKVFADVEPARAWLAVQLEARQRQAREIGAAP